MDLFLRITTIFLFLVWRGYWWITEQKADKEKPKNKETASIFSWKRLHRYFVYAFGASVFSQLLGVSILPMQSMIAIHLFGFCLVVLGLGSAILARYSLGTNWANSYEYQVKQKQQLITTGIYAYIRNPIYSGLVVAVIGAELVADSYLFLVYFIFFWGAYKQSKLEEKILEEHFGKEYRDYKKRTKVLIPFVF